MNLRSTVVAIALGSSILLGACKSEIDDKPAAQVTEETPPLTSSPDLAATSTAQAAVSSRVIKEKSSIGFVGAKLTEDHVGSFEKFDGTVEHTGGQPTAISFEIDPASVKTGIDKLDGHLRSKDFFDVQTNPKVTFNSTAIKAEPGANGATHRVEGLLTLRGQEKTISFPVAVKTGPQEVQARSQFTINRQDWGVAYRGAPDNLIKDEVLIKLDLRFPPLPAT